MPDPQRLFFALWPGAELQAQIHDTLQAHIAGHGQATPAHNLHITLAFLGSTPAAGRACYEQAATGIIAAGFDLLLHHIGHWPKPRVLWLGPDDSPDALQALLQSLQQAIVPCGFIPETRPYQPHMTVSRKFAGTWSGKTIDPIAWRVDDFALVESVTTQSGPLYQVLRRWPLGRC